jgi:hypothetical protein
MGAIQRRFKSPVYRMNIEEQKKLLTMKSTTRSQLRKGDRPWEGRLWESHQPMNKNLIRGRQNGTSGQNTTKFPYSVLEVNEAVGWRRFQGLPTEISLTCGRGFAAAHLAAMAGVIDEKSAEVIVKWSRNGRMKEA